MAPAGLAAAQASNAMQRDDETSQELEQVASTPEILFYFIPDDSMFFYDINEESIKEAGEMIKRYRPEIERGDILISVNGYSVSLGTTDSNSKMTKVYSNQIKSYYITNLGIKEENYITRNHTVAYNDSKNVVAVLKLVRLKRPEPQDLAAQDASASKPSVPTVESAPKSQTELQSEPASEDLSVDAARMTPAVENSDESVDSSADNLAGGAAAQDTPSAPASSQMRQDGENAARWSLKTNIPAWALVVANVAAEYRFADHWSIDVPVYYSCWTTATTYRFRTLTVQPSVRYWLGSDWKGHFFGAHFTAGQFNVSVDSNTRYQDVNGMYGAGLDYGYALKFSKHWGLEFNIGVGYIGTRYNSYYNIPDGARFDTSDKNYWGVTRCGISLIYRIK